MTLNEATAAHQPVATPQPVPQRNVSPVAGTHSADETSLSAAQANILASSTEQVRRLNADLKHRYLSAFADYVANMQSGGFVPAERRTPPTPPKGWQLAAPDDDGFVFYELGQIPVCDQPPAVNYNGGITAPVKVPNTIDVGKRLGTSKWFGVGPLDTLESGKETPPGTVSSDGVSGVFEKFAAVVGAGWYLQTS